LDLDKSLIKKLLRRRIESHNKRFLGVPGKKAIEELVFECFNRGCFRAKNYGESDNNKVAKAGFRRLKEYFYVLRNGYPRLGADIIVSEDFDILPKGHRMHSKIETYHLINYDYFTDEVDIDKYRLEITDTF
tara:strand:- start:415 stop:810 length:396 start_codon:yes stop_codon:yes gene_type:complete